MNYPHAIQIVFGFFIGILVSLLAKKAKTLDTSGAIAAALTGGAIFAFGGFPWAAVLLTFFISSSLLSKFFRIRKESISEKFAKGNERDWGQVLANGLLGTIFVVSTLFFRQSSIPWLGFIGAMATVNADTWATELGVLNPSAPRLITNFHPVEAGTSGGISLLGTLSTMGGALLIGLIGALFNHQVIWYSLALISLGAGLAGSLFDSLLGASLQAIYYCKTCAKETERHPVHSCGNRTHHLRGLQWLNNDAVNFLASLVGAGIAIAIGLLLA